MFQTPSVTKKLKKTQHFNFHVTRELYRCSDSLYLYHFSLYREMYRCHCKMCLFFTQKLLFCRHILVRTWPQNKNFPLRKSLFQCSPFPSPFANLTTLSHNSCFLLPRSCKLWNALPLPVAQTLTTCLYPKQKSTRSIFPPFLQPFSLLSLKGLTQSFLAYHCLSLNLSLILILYELKEQQSRISN